MWTALGKFALRFPAARLGRSALVIVAVALGTALLTALLVLSESLSRNLDAQLDRRYGAHDMIAGYSEPDRYLTPAELQSIRSSPGVKEVAVSLDLTRGPVEPGALTVKGIAISKLYTDPLPLTAGHWPGPGEVVVSDTAAKEKNVKIGESLALAAGDQTLNLLVTGLYAQPPDSPVNTAYVEAEWLRQTMSLPGFNATRIDLDQAADPVTVMETLKNKVSGLDVQIRLRLQARRDELNMLRPLAQGLGMIALLASGFLVAGAFSFSLFERTAELGVLRSLGAARWQLAGLVLAEAALLGGSGSALGLLAGMGIARAATDVVGQWLAVEMAGIHVPWPNLPIVWIGGVVVTVLFAMRAAVTAARVPPVAAWRPPDTNVAAARVRRWGVAGLVLASVGLVALVVPWLLPKAGGWADAQALLGSGGSLLTVIGLVLAMPALLGLLIPLVAAPMRFIARVEVLLASRFLLLHRGRSAMSAGAFSLGLVLLIGMSTFVQTFTVKAEADVRKEYPTDAVLQIPAVYNHVVAPGIVAKARQTPGVTDVTALGPSGVALMPDHDWSHADPALLAWWKEIGAAPYQIPFGIADVAGLARINLLKVERGEITTDGAVITEPFAKQYGIELGETLTLDVPAQENLGQSEIQATVTAVVSVPQSFPKLLVSVRDPESLPGVQAVYINGSPDAMEQVRRFLEQAPQYDSLKYSDTTMARQKLQFEANQRLAIVYAVIVVMGLISGLSLISSLLAGLQERRQELATFQVIGGAQGQVVRMVLCEAMILGLCGSIVGEIGGLLLGRALLLGLEFPSVAVPWTLLAVGLFSGAALPAVVGLLPAYYARRYSARELLKPA